MSGNFSQQRSNRPATPTAVPSNFQASPEAALVAGATVLHLKFGAGKILSVEGPKDNRVATIQFQNDNMAERRIVLKFAKLQVVD